MTRDVDVVARVRHEEDRSYAVTVEGPGGVVDVGRTRRTGDLLSLARAGAARHFRVPEDRVTVTALHVPPPPHVREGQVVRVVAEDPPEDRGAIGCAHWFGHEAAWFVTTATGTGLVPTEDLDADPRVEEAELTALDGYLASQRRT